jgi:hypothetical protein
VSHDEIEHVVVDDGRGCFRRVATRHKVGRESNEKLISIGH